MKKVLIIASVASMIDQFNMPNIDILQKKGYEVHVATNFEYGSTSSKQRVGEFKRELMKLNVTYYQVDFSRNITDILANIKAYKLIKNLMLKNNYEFVHCHSPIGGVCGRLAAHSTSTFVIYTAHGFHFFKGAPFKNWLLFYPIERFLARYTDVLITINKEDYKRAKNFNAKNVIYIPGVGVDTKKFSKMVVDRLNKRKELGVPKDAVLILSVGELNKNKNHETIIKAIAKINNPHVYYVICGQGVLESYLIELATSLAIANQVKLIGFRTDVKEIYKVADIFAFPSKREGLGLAALEAMASGLPLITSNIHGIVDYSVDGDTGFTCVPNDVNEFSRAINKLIIDKEEMKRMSNNNLRNVQYFDLKMFTRIYVLVMLKANR
jgi:glycosyltransferase involved in cell wall biosynthesis